MKNFVFISIAAALMLFSCNGKLKKLEQENQRLAMESQQQDSLLNDFMEAFNDFEENLTVIKERENLIAVQSEDPEIQKEGKDRINEDLQMIGDLMAKNRQIIEDLNEKLKNSEIKNKQFRRMIARLNQQLAEKDTSIAQLTAQLADANIQVEELNTRVSDLSSRTEALAAANEEKTARMAEQEARMQEQREMLENQTEELNTAYFIAGTAKELKEKNVIVKAKKINNDFAEDAFTRIDITQTQNIPFDSKKARLLTSHPSYSYELVDTNEDKRIDQLSIKDPNAFWKHSRYLVVVLN